MLLWLLLLSLSLLSPSSLSLLSLLVLLFSNKSVIERSKNTQFGDSDLHYFLLFIYFLGEGRKWWNKLSPVFYGVGWVKQPLWCLIASGVFRIWGISRVQVNSLFSHRLKSHHSFPGFWCFLFSIFRSILSSLKQKEKENLQGQGTWLPSQYTSSIQYLTRFSNFVFRKSRWIGPAMLSGEGQWRLVELQKL